MLLLVCGTSNIANWSRMLMTAALFVSSSSVFAPAPVPGRLIPKADGEKRDESGNGERALGEGLVSA
jgi:hypothetical protein